MKLKSHIIDLLKRIGLSDTEAKFYIAVHENPKLTIKDVQEKSKLSRASAYRAFEKLHDMKLLTSSPDNWRKNVEVVSLSSVADKLAREQRKLRKVELELKRLNNLMNLSSQYSQTEDPVEILFDQNQIVEKCYEIIRRPWDKMLCYGSAERLIDVIGDKPERDYVLMRSKKGKAADAILTELGDYTKEFIPNNHRELRNVKLRIDPENQNYATYVYGDEAIIWHTDKELGKRAIVIKEPALVKMYENSFRSLWDKN